MTPAVDDPIGAVLNLHRLLSEGVEAPDLAQVAVNRVSELMRGTAALWLLMPDGEVEAVAFGHADPTLAEQLQRITGGVVRGPHRLVRMMMDSDKQVRLDARQLVEVAPLMEPVYQSWFTLQPVSGFVLQPLHMSGRSIGLLGIARDADQTPLDDGEQQLLTQVAQVMTAALQAQLVHAAQEQLITQTRESEAQLYALAHTDDLTQLPNRRGFLQALNAVEQPLRAPLVVSLLDLDDFKDVNDGFGHAAGDGLLVAFAACMSGALPAGSLMARMGGDEFSILLRPEEGADAEREFTDVLDTCPDTLPIFHIDVPVSVSAGLTMRSTGENAAAGELLREADVAMYRAKREGLRLTSFDADADTAALSRLRDAVRIRSAIEQDELVLHYQRVVPGCAPDGPARFEALVRWPTGDDLHLPGAFLPLARELNLMDAVTDLVVVQAVKQLSLWSAAGHPARVAINVPSSSLARPGFVHDLAARLATAGLPADALAVEVTEGELVDAAALAAVKMCRSLGLPVAIDDFGMGYSALGYLLEVPAAELKIDRLLVQRLDHDPHKRILVQHCVSLAHALGLEVVAEGVETPGEHASLIELGVNWLQGFLFHRPCPVEALD